MAYRAPWPYAKTRYRYLIDTAARVSPWGWHSLAMGDLSRFVARSAIYPPITLVYRYQLYPIEQEACRNFRLLRPGYASDVVPAEHFSQRALENWDDVLGDTQDLVPFAGFPCELLVQPHSRQIIQCLAKRHGTLVPERLDTVEKLRQVIEIHGQEPYFGTFAGLITLGPDALTNAIQQAATIMPVLASMGAHGQRIVDDMFDFLASKLTAGSVTIGDALTFLVTVTQVGVECDAMHRTAADLARMCSAVIPTDRAQVDDAARQYEHAKPSESHGR